MTFNFQGLYEYLLARASERSTWVGAIALLSSAGVALNPHLANWIAATGSASAGLLLVFTTDKTPPKSA